MDKTEVVVVKEAWELSEFETEYTPVPSQPIKWSMEKYKVAQMLALSGKNKKETAKELGLPLSIINKWLENGEFVEYMDSLVAEHAKALANHRVRTLNKILQARIEQAECEGYADLSRKDTVDIISELRKETEGAGTTAAGAFSSLLENLMKHSQAHQPKTIDIGAT